MIYCDELLGNWNKNKLNFVRKRCCAIVKAYPLAAFAGSVREISLGFYEKGQPLWLWFLMQKGAAGTRFPCPLGWGSDSSHTELCSDTWGGSGRCSHLHTGVKFTS